MGYHFRNLVFEGGGVKGVAYLGALAVLREKGILDGITRVGGTSAGAITALLVGLGYGPDQIEAEVRSLDFKKFLDDSFGIVRDTDRLLNDFGWYKGDAFREWTGRIIGQKTGNSESTFGDVAGMKEAKGFRDLYFIGTNLSTGFAEVFSAEHTPRMCVADAVRISMSIPLFFAAKRGIRGDVYVDGGVLDNYPVKLFDRQKYAEAHAHPTDYYAERNELLSQSGKTVSPYIYNEETLGFRLDSASEIAVFRDQAEPPHRPIGDFFDYVKALVATVLNVQEGQHLHSDDWQRTIYIDTLDVGATDFDITDDRKNELVASGRTGAEHYFAWYDNPGNTPVNRPG
ncbi:patatin-like phospholipase family protein [Geobacter sp.]|uniref:patatin-like phospholipase family protein n=1 Tax=Geobacter sp. TaxID=46610 RepID=UPI00262B81CA|nr:patatin-like phospholipase family protein [Geobacter sp.]